MQSGQLATSFQEPKGVVYCLALSPDGKLLVAGCGDALAYVWNLEEKKLVATLKDHSLPVVSVSFAANGKTLVLATASLDKTVQVWEAETWKPDRVRTTLEAPVQRLFRGRGRPPLRRSAPAGRDCRRSRQPLAANSPGRQGAGLGQGPGCQGRDRRGHALGLPLAQDAKGRRLAYVACSDATVKEFFWDSVHGKLDLIATLRGHSDWVYAIVANADKTRFASASSDGSVKLWNAADNSPLATLVQLSPGKDDWLIVSGQGYFATSTPAAVQWKAAGVKAAAEKLSALQNPELVRQMLAGKKVPPPVLQ